VLEVLNRIRKSENDFLQGGIFIGNIFLRWIKHLYIQKICQSALRAKKWNLHQFKHSDTLFILASGQSIAGYSKDQFAEINRHDSVGFNFWLLHPFVPTYYIGEFLPDSERSNLLWKNLSMRALDYCRIPVILKYSSAFWHDRHLLPKALQEVFIASHLSIPGMSRGSLSRWLKILDRFNVLCGWLPAGLIVFRQASLSWLLIFALKLGYKKIVLCGVDLNTPKYFYDIETGFCQERGLFIPPSEFSSAVHPTNNPLNCSGSLAITDVLHIMDETLFKKRGAEIFVGAESSALFPGFPLYPWQDK
jgi:hypothetical protein